MTDAGPRTRSAAFTRGIPRRRALPAVLVIAVLATSCSLFQQGYPTNANGETYGSSVDASQFGEEPDLIEAFGDNGVRGYVRRTDLEEPPPRSPAEAVARQNARKGHQKVVPLYESDGETVIGTFTMGPNTVHSTERATEK